MATTYSKNWAEKMALYAKINRRIEIEREKGEEMTDFGHGWPPFAPSASPLRRKIMTDKIQDRLRGPIKHPQECVNQRQEAADYIDQLELDIKERDSRIATLEKYAVKLEAEISDTDTKIEAAKEALAKLENEGDT